MGKAKRLKQERRTKGKEERPLPKKNIKKAYYVIFVTLFLIATFFGVKLYKKEVVEANGGLDPVKGAPDGKVTIVEFSDFQCPACGVMYPVVDEMVKRYPKDVRVVYKNFPLTTIHRWAYTAALASECAFDQGKFWEFHDIVFDRQSAWSRASDAREDFLRYAKELGMDQESFNSCIDSAPIKKRVDNDIREGDRLNINSTPTFFINKKRYVGVWNVKELDRIIRKALEKG